MKTRAELLLLATKTTRIDRDTFLVPSESDSRKTWEVNLEMKTCRDNKSGAGCPQRYYHPTCKHIEACSLIVTLVKQWEYPKI